MQLVPFDEKWAGSETKLDLKAWYRRPSRHGGFSLAAAEDVVQVRGLLAAKGMDLSAVAASYDHQGHFKMAEYLKTERVRDDAFKVELQAKVDAYGLQAVTELMRMSDPDFVMTDGIAVKNSRLSKAVPPSLSTDPDFVMPDGIAEREPVEQPVKVGKAVKR